MNQSDQEAINIFVFDGDGSPIAGASVELIEGSEIVTRGSTRGERDTPLRLYFPSTFDSVLLRARADGIVIEKNVDANAGNYSFEFKELPRATWVLSLHGIETRGSWQKELTDDLNAAHLMHEPLDYGLFRGLKLLFPSLRRRQLNWFREEYTRHVQEKGGRPSIVAHSFGTYLVCRSMELYSEICFDKVIFCGSIVRREYPWNKLAPTQAKRVLNDFGHEDFWAKIAGWVIEDAGPSGSLGFNETAGGLLVQREHREFRHSDYFYTLNYRKNWIPFLKGDEPVALTASDRRPTNWRFVIVKTVFFLTVALIVFLILHFAFGWI